MNVKIQISIDYTELAWRFICLLNHLFRNSVVHFKSLFDFWYSIEKKRETPSSLEIWWVFQVLIHIMWVGFRFILIPFFDVYQCIKIILTLMCETEWVIEYVSVCIFQFFEKEIHWFAWSLFSFCLRSHLITQINWKMFHISGKRRKESRKHRANITSNEFHFFTLMSGKKTQIRSQTMWAGSWRNGNLCPCFSLFNIVVNKET